jgi:mannonate dehydratase
MNRRNCLQILGAGLMTLQGCKLLPVESIINPCLGPSLPDWLAKHNVILSALDGLDPDLLWDGHVHLIGTGDSKSGIWINPDMLSFLHPVQYAQFGFYTNAACVNSGAIDINYVQRLKNLHSQMPNGTRLLLLAFDYTHDKQGRLRPDLSAFYTPNSYASRLAHTYPEIFDWIASIHPYREDCVEILQDVVTSGARAIKWLPSAMGIDPGSTLCDRFYEALVKHDIPLLTHAGEEQAVHGANRQEFGNPLLLRRPLEHGVRVIVAHCASLGQSMDIDAGQNGKLVPAFDLFSRLMQEDRYEGLLFGEISGLTQSNRLGIPLTTLITRSGWHSRLINASDYPLPGVMPLFSMSKMMKYGYINREQANVLTEVRKYNALLFDLVLKRHLQVDGIRFSPIVFHGRRLFDKTNSLL